MEAGRLPEQPPQLNDPLTGVGPVVLPRGRLARTPAGGFAGVTLTDFGRQTLGRPAVIYRPTSVAAAARAVAEARAAGHLSVPRGLGHSVDGQTIAAWAALIDLSAFRGVGPVTATSVTVNAGATWRDVLTETLRQGRGPLIVPDYLDLTVGGTLSMGGISGLSHRFGTAADHVLRGTIIDDEGRAHTVEQGDARLDQILGGQGRHGLLASVTMALRTVPALVRRSDIVTHSLRDHVEIQRNLLVTGQAHWIEGSATLERGSGWVFRTWLAQPEDPGQRPLSMDTTRGRSTFAAYVARNDAVIAQARASGLWSQGAHPRLQAILPLQTGTDLVEQLLARTPHELLGPGGTVMLHVTNAGTLSRLAVKGDDNGHALIIGWQRTAAPGDAGTLRRMQAENRDIAEAAVAAGGVLYPSGYTGWTTQPPRFIPHVR